MTTKTLQITPPEGYEIDRQNSTLDNIVFKELEKKPVELWHKLKNIDGYYIGDKSHILIHHNNRDTTLSKNTCKTEQQAEGLLALSMLSQLYYEFDKGERDNGIESDENIVIIKDVKNNTDKLIVIKSKNHFFLNFNNYVKAQLFLELHKDLIDTASVWY